MAKHKKKKPGGTAASEPNTAAQLPPTARTKNRTKQQQSNVAKGGQGGGGGGGGGGSIPQFAGLAAVLAVAVVSLGVARSGNMLDIVAGTGSGSMGSPGNNVGSKRQTSSTAASHIYPPPPPFHRNANAFKAAAGMLQPAAVEWYESTRRISDTDSLCGAGFPRWDAAQLQDLALSAVMARGSDGWAQPLRTALMILLRLNDHQGLDTFLKTISPLVGPVAMRAITGAPALHLATSNSDGTCLAKHLLKGAFDRDGWLQEYTSQINTTALKFEHSVLNLPRLNVTDSESVQQTVVRKWANAKSTLCMQHLVRYADVDEQDTFGETAMHVAAFNGNEAAVRLLIAIGADADHPGRGMTPVEMASLRGYEDVLAALVEGDARMSPMAEELALLSMREPMEGAPGAESTHKSTSKGGLGTDSGGWETDETIQSAADLHSCNLAGRLPDIVDAKDASADLFEQFYHTKRPLVVRGAAFKWDFRSKWTSEKMLKKFGKRKVDYGAVPYSSFFNGTLERGPLERAVSGARGDYYIFTAADANELVEDVLEFGKAPLPLPTLFQDSNLAADPKILQFYLGGPSTGAPVHFHDDAWNALAFGRKRWFLWEPDSAFYRKDATMEWATHHLEKHCNTCKLSIVERAGAEHPCPIEFVQYPGDVVYVPRGFAHATLNIQTSIGFAVEFQTVTSTEWGSLRYNSDKMKPIADEDIPTLDESDGDDLLEEVLEEAGAGAGHGTPTKVKVEPHGDGTSESGSKSMPPKNWRKGTAGHGKGKGKGNGKQQSNEKKLSGGPNFNFIGKK